MKIYNTNNCGFGENDTNYGQEPGEMKSKNVRDEAKHCDLESEK